MHDFPSPIFRRPARRTGDRISLPRPADQQRTPGESRYRYPLPQTTCGRFPPRSEPGRAPRARPPLRSRRLRAAFISAGPPAQRRHTPHRTHRPAPDSSYRSPPCRARFYSSPSRRSPRSARPTGNGRLASPLGLTHRPAAALARPRAATYEQLPVEQSSQRPTRLNQLLPPPRPPRRPTARTAAAATDRAAATTNASGA